MNKKINEISNRYGRLLVIETASSRNSRAYWLCKCDCGNTHAVMGKLLRAGKVKSCGCWLVDNPPALLPDDLGPKRLVYRGYIKSAAERGLRFDLDFDDFTRLTQSNCYYCGSPPLRSHHHYTNYLYNGLDRKNNSLGYIISNVVPCCWGCNRRKLDTNYNDFIDWIRRVVSYHGL